MKVEQYGFVLSAAQDSQLNIEQCYRYKKASLVMAGIPVEDGNRLLNSCLEEQGDCGMEIDNLLTSFDCHFLLLVWKSQDEDRLLFFSDTRQVRALEFLDYLVSEFGLVRGNAECASGQISSAILSVQIADMDLTNSVEYFLQRSMSYFEECDWINAKEFGMNNQGLILEMTKYYKKEIPWAYVKSTDVVPAGEQIRIKSLENESGMLLTASEERYIMIGCRGEVYDINSEKFARTYRPTDEPLDVFEQMLDFLPAIEKVSNGDYISLDEMAKLCYPRRGVGIYACELERRTKVFPAGDNTEYFLGVPGDYMAIRMDEFTDVYVVQREIFRQTYESEK